MEKKKKLEELQKKRIQKLKMKSLLLKRHDPEEDYDEELELSTEEEVVTLREESTLLSTLASPAGAYVMVSLVILFAINFVLNSLTDESKGGKRVSQEKKTQ